MARRLRAAKRRKIRGKRGDRDKPPSNLPKRSEEAVEREALRGGWLMSQYVNSDGKIVDPEQLRNALMFKVANGGLTGNSQDARAALRLIASIEQRHEALELKAREVELRGGLPEQIELNSEQNTVNVSANEVVDELLSRNDVVDAIFDRPHMRRLHGNGNGNGNGA